MPKPISPQSSPSDSALRQEQIAFVRGVERQAIMFIYLQLGDGTPAEELLWATLKSFSAEATPATRNVWTILFWRWLLHHVSHHPPSQNQFWPEQLSQLQTLSQDRRALLLLRTVAQLSPEDTRKVLTIRQDVYEQAYHAALPRTSAGTPDLPSWHQMLAYIEYVRAHIPAAKLAHLAKIRESALVDDSSTFTEATTSVEIPELEQADAAEAPAWRRPALVAVAIMTVVGLASTFIFESIPLLNDEPDGSPTILVKELPPSRLNITTEDPEVELLTHPQFDQLLKPETSIAAQEPAFYLWLANNADTVLSGDASTSSQTEHADNDPALESDDVDL